MQYNSYISDVYNKPNRLKIGRKLSKLWLFKSTCTMLRVSEHPVVRWPPCADVDLHWPAARTRHLAFIWYLWFQPFNTVKQKLMYYCLCWIFRLECCPHRYHIKARCLVRAAGQWSSTSAHGGHLTTGCSLTHNMVHVLLNNHNLLNFLPIFKRFGLL